VKTDTPVFKPASPFSIRNVRLFVVFRICFNARFYYPVFTILFLDFGLTVSQFALLNAVWAATIVAAEVPSGALADIIGRRRLVVCAGAIMVIEILLLCFAPRGNADLLFAVFLVNRILSGIAEASASGADEALAYDALKLEGDEKDWGRVLEVQMRTQSIAYILAMTIGAAVYDPALMQSLAGLLGIEVAFTQDITLRLPLFLTLVMAIATLLATLGMRETSDPQILPECTEKTCSTSIFQALRLTLQAGRWILRTPFALVVIAAGLLFDGVIRMVITLSSQYYRLIDLPEASFGLIGAAIAGLGIFIPRLALKMAHDHAPVFNFTVMTVLALVGLLGMTFFLPVIGLAPAVVLFSAMYLTSFFTSHYLNQMTDSSQRATVLSFKGLSFNLSYGLIGILYSLLLALLRHDLSGTGPETGGQLFENLIFIRSFACFPRAFLLALVVLVGFSWWQLKKSGVTEAIKKP
jgi:MFS family permease